MGKRFTETDRAYGLFAVAEAGALGELLEIEPNKIIKSTAWGSAQDSAHWQVKSGASV